MPAIPICPYELTASGVLPIIDEVTRFAVGDPDGLSSNAWRVWASVNGDIYISCRDNFKEVKVSLHTSGRWRIGFTSEAVTANPALVPDGGNRAWDVWNKPPETLPDTVVAFHLFFLTSELAVEPAQRQTKTWKGVAFIEAGPPGKLTALTLFVTRLDQVLQHATERSFCLARWHLPDGWNAQLVAHADDEGTIPAQLAAVVAHAKEKFSMEKVGEQLPHDAYIYAVGHMPTGARFFCRRSGFSVFIIPLSNSATNPPRYPRNYRVRSAIQTQAQHLISALRKSRVLAVRSRPCGGRV